MPVTNIKITLEASDFKSESKEVISTIESVGAVADKSLGKATSGLAQTNTGIDNLKDSFDALVDKIGLPIEKFGELKSEIAITAQSGVRNISGIKDSLSNLSRESGPPLKSLTQDVHRVSSAITQIDFPFMSDGFRSVTNQATNFVNVLATSTGGVAFAVFGITSLISVINQAIPRESELAAERKKTAEETIKITEAEIARVNQAAETDESVHISTEKLRTMNEQLIRQQIILSDINLKTYAEDLEEAKNGVDSFFDKVNSAPPMDVKIGVMTEISRTATIARELFKKHGGDIVKIQTDVEQQISSISERQISFRGLLGKQEEVNLNVRKEALREISDQVKGAATAQKNYNSEIENQIRLIQALNTPDKGIAPPEIQTPDFPEAKPIVQPVEFGEVHAKEIKLPSLGLEDFSAVQAEEIKMVDLKFQTHLSSEEQYLNDKRALLEQQATFMADFYGAESQQALEANLRKIQFDEEYARKKKLTEQQSAHNTLQITANLMANAQGINEGLFVVGKAASIAQATVDTYAAANKALTAYVPPFSYIAAAATIATGLLNVSKINATKFERKAEGGILGDMGRQVMAANFGGDNGLFIGHSDEFVVNADSTRANRALLELINASEGAVRMNTARQNGGPLGSTGSTSSPSTGSGAAPLIDMSDVVQAIRDIKIEVRAELDAIKFYRQTLPVYEKEEARRRLA